MACAVLLMRHLFKEINMGYLIDFFYLLKELFKLFLWVLISPFGLLAGYFLSWQ